MEENLKEGWSWEGLTQGEYCATEYRWWFLKIAESLWGTGWKGNGINDCAAHILWNKVKSWEPASSIDSTRCSSVLHDSSLAAVPTPGWASRSPQTHQQLAATALPTYPPTFLKHLQIIQISEGPSYLIIGCHHWLEVGESRVTSQVSLGTF